MFYASLLVSVSVKQINQSFEAPKGVFKYYVSTFGGEGGMSQNAGTDDALKGVGGL